MLDPTAPSVSETMAKAAATFSAADSAARLRRFRSACKAADVECILIVGGIDSKDNEHCNRAINYLLSGAAFHQMTTTTLLDSRLEDTIILVHPSGVTVYTTPPAGYAVAASTALWPNCDVLTLDAATFASNQSVFEMHKMLAIKSIANGYKRVGIPHGGATAMIVEKWPIIQAYAIDANADGKARFFTMDKTVVDVADAVKQHCYAEIDAHDVATLMVGSVPMVGYHWNACLKDLDRRRADYHAMSASERSDCVTEALQLYVQYGGLQNAAKDSVPAPEMRSGSAYFSLTATDPATPLRMARSYFTTSAKTNDFARSAVAAYDTAVVAMLAVSESALSGSTLSAALQDALAAAKTSASQEWEFTVSVDALDLSLYRPGVPATAPGTQIVFARIEMVAPAASSEPPMVLGDTFVVNGGTTYANLTTSIPYVDFVECGKEEIQMSAALKTLISDALDKPPSQRKPTSQLGSLIDEFDGGDGVVAFVHGGPATNGLSCDGKVAIFEKGFVVTHKRHGAYAPVVMSASKVGRVVLTNVDSLTGPIVLQVFPVDGATLPPWCAMRATDGPLSLVFRESSTARVEFVLGALAQWKKQWASEGIDVQHSAEGLVINHPAVLRHIAQGEKSRSRQTFRLGDDTKSSNLSEDPETNIRESRKAIIESMAKCGKVLEVVERIRSSDLDSVAPSPVPAAASAFINIHLIAGVPGCQKHKLVNFVRRALDSEGAAQRQKQQLPPATRVFAVPLKDSFGLTVAALEHFLADIRTQCTTAAYSTVHALVCVPGSVSIASAVEKTLQASASAVGGNNECTLASTTTIVDLGLFYATDASPPFHVARHVLSTLVPGYVNQVLVQSAPRSKVQSGRVERFIKDMYFALQPVDRNTLPFAFAYSHDEVLSNLRILADHSASQGLEPLSSPRMAHWRHTAQGGSWLHTRPQDDLQLLILNFPKLALSEPQITHFMTLISSFHLHDASEAAETQLHADDYAPFANVERLKASLHVDGRSVEVIAVKNKQFLNRYRPRHVDDVLRQDQEFIFIGHRLDAKAIEAYVGRYLAYEGSIVRDMNGCEPRVTFHGRRPLITSEALTQQDINQIVLEANDVPLPAGWCYESGAYRNTENPDAPPKHERPDVAELVAEFVRRRNKEITEMNARFAGVSIPDNSPSRESDRSST